MKVYLNKSFVVAFLTVMFSVCLSALAFAYTPCQEDVRLICPYGYYDGCLMEDNYSKTKELTYYHVCVSAVFAYHAEEFNLCKFKDDLVCLGVGEIDACRVKHQKVSERHICILE